MTFLLILIAVKNFKTWLKGGYNEDAFPFGFDGLKIPDRVWSHTSDRVL